MQDKIQEIMVLVYEYGSCVEATVIRDSGDREQNEESRVLGEIHSKLRELVREPLSHELVWTIAVVSDSPLDAIRKTERAHNITNTIGEAKE